MAARPQPARMQAAAQQLQGRAQHQADLGRLMRTMTTANERTHELAALREATRIPKFDRKKESFPVFTERFRTAMSLYGDQFDVETCKRALVGLLERPEKLLHDALPQAIRETDDFGVFLQALFEVYHSATARRIARDQLYALRQKTSETVDEWRARVEDAALLAYPFLEGMQERQAASRDTFVRGLRAKLRDRVRDRDPETLAAAYNHAIRYELNDAVKEQEKEKESTSMSELVNAIAHLTTRHDQRPRDYSRDRYRSPGRRDYSQSRPREFHRRDYSQSRQRDFYPRDRSQSRSRGNQYQGPSNNNRRGRGAGNGGRRGGGRGGGNRHVQFMTIVSLIAIFISPSLAAPYPHCLKSQGGLLIAPAHPTQCTAHSPAAVVRGKVEVFVTNSTVAPATAWKCIVETYMACTESTVWFPSRNVTRVHRRPATGDECRVAVRERMFHSRPLLPHANTSDMFSSYPETVEYPPVTFFSAVCVKFITMVAERSTVASFEEGSIMTPLLTNTRGCRGTDRECADDTGMVVWEGDLVRDECKIISVGEYVGLIGDKTVVIESMQAALTLHSQKSHSGTHRRCFSVPVWETRQGSFLTFPEWPRMVDLKEAEALQNETILTKLAVEEKPGRVTRSVAESRWKLPKDYEGMQKWTMPELGEALLSLKVVPEEVAYHHVKFTVEPRVAVIRAIAAKALLREIHYHFKSMPFDELEREIKERVTSEEGRILLQEMESFHSLDRRVVYEAFGIVLETGGNRHPERGVTSLVDITIGKVQPRTRADKETLQFTSPDAVSIYADAVHEFLKKKALIESEEEKQAYLYTVFGEEKELNEVLDLILAKKRTIRGASNPKPVVTSTPPVSVTMPVESDIIGSVGSEPHVKFMHTGYDDRAERRRNITDASANVKLNFLSHRIVSVMREQFGKAYSAICKLQQSQLSTWWAILRIDPTIGIRTILGRYDVAGEFVGEDVIKVIQCQSVEIARIAPSKSIDGECWAYIPAFTPEGKRYFIVPGTRDLSLTSPQEDCASIQPIVYLDGNGTYVSSDNETIAVKVLRGDSIGMEEIQGIEFTAPGLFRSAMGSAFPLELAISYGASIQSLRRQTAGIMEVIHRPSPLKSIADFSFNAAVKLKNETLGALWDKYRKMLLWVGIPIVSLLVIGGILFIAVKFYLARAAFSSLLPVNAVYDDFDEPPTPPRQLVDLSKPFLPSAPPLRESVYALSGAKEKLPFVPVSIGNRSTVSLWDSGASCTYCRVSVAKSLGLRWEKTTRTGQGVGDGPGFTFIGQVSVTLRIGDTFVDTQMLISSDCNCPAPMLIGGDVMTELDRRGVLVCLQLHYRILRIGDASVPLVTNPKHMFRAGAETGKAYTVNSEPVVIQPKASLEIPIQFEVTSPGRCIIRPEKKHLPFFGFVFHMDTEAKAETTVAVRNAGTTPITVDPQTELGKVLEVKKLALLPPHVPPEALEYQEHLPPQRKTDGEPDGIDSIDLSKSDFTEQQRNEMRSVFRECADAFCTGGRLGLFNGPIEHEIPFIEGAPLPKPRSYPTPLHQRPLLEKELQNLLEQGVIEPSTSPLLSPVLLVAKPDGSKRMVVDMRSVNSITKSVNYLLPSMSEIHDMASHSFILSTVDLASGFWQVNLKEEDRWKTAFHTHKGSFHFRRLVMGLSTAPATFNRVIQFIRRHITAKVYCYLDDILIVSPSREQHIQDIKEVLRTLIRFGLKAKAKKCNFGMREVTFVGLLVGRDGIKPDPKKVAAVQEFPRPTTVGAVRSFLGLSGYFRRFIEGYARIAAPLHDLLKKDEEFQWSDDCEKAFLTLKSKLITAPVLIGPTPGRPFFIECDASSIAIGGALYQERTPGTLQPIAYCSRKLNQHERNYKPLEAEALGMLYCCTEFRIYVLASDLTLITDHAPLCSLMSRTQLSDRLARYQLALQAYNPKIRYRKGTLNHVADALSRYFIDESKEPLPPTRPKPKPQPQPLPVKAPVDATESVCFFAIEDLKSGQEKSAETRSLMASLGEQKSEYYSRSDNVLMRVNPKGADQIMIPSDGDLAKKLTRLIHEDPAYGAHGGIARTTDAVRRRFFIRNQQSVSTQVVQECSRCAERKTRPGDAKVEPQGTLEEVTQCFERWHLDFLGPLPQASTGEKYILVCVCAFSRYIVAEACKDQTIPTTVRFLNRVFSQFGPPHTLVSDRGTTFLSHAVRSLLDEWGVVFETSCPYQKNKNGLAERANRSIGESLACSIPEGEQSQWPQLLPKVLLALNCHKNVTIGNSPYRILFGQEPRLPSDNKLKVVLPDSARVAAPHRVEDRRKAKAMDAVRKVTMRDVTDRSRKAKARDVRVGDSVLLRRSIPLTKFDRRFHKGFTVETVHPKKVTVRDTEGKFLTYHKDHVKVEKHRRGACDGAPLISIPVPVQPDPAPTTRVTRSAARSNATRVDRSDVTARRREATPHPQPPLAKRILRKHTSSEPHPSPRYPKRDRHTPSRYRN